MKTNIALVGLLILFFSSCVSPSYLPSPDKIDVYAYGSYIRINPNTASFIDGELIAIDSNEIWLLTEETKGCMAFPVNDVKHFSLIYAKPKPDGWTIPVYTLATIAHGWLAILTAPLNLIVTISVAVSRENTFKYSEKNMTIKKLRTFARFPQGIPPNIDLATIMPNPAQNGRPARSNARRHPGIRR